VLTHLKWADVSASPFLTALKAAATDGLLSIKFNVDSIAGCIFLDLGNALSTNARSGQPNDLGDLVIAVAGSSSPLGTIPSQGAGGYASEPTWYSRTAGVVALPLTAAQLQAPSNLVHPKQVPPVATPTDAIQFSASATTNAQGLALMSLKTSNPGTPCSFNNGQDYGLDGQVYGIRPSFTGPLLTGGPVNQWNFISLLLWSGFTTGQPVTWSDVEQIFVQYANLYPVVNRFLNMADYNTVVANASLLTLAFGLNPANPNAMPVTRDLSPAKRQAILFFLANPLPATQVKSAPPREENAEEPSPAASKAARMGGKASAASRRIVV
jgi:hypothetical protein